LLQKANEQNSGAMIYLREAKKVEGEAAEMVVLYAS
jgi:hypothetical protein